MKLFFVFLLKKKKIEKTEDANKVFFEILNSEKANGMILDAYEGATKEFNPNIVFAESNELYNSCELIKKL